MSKIARLRGPFDSVQRIDSSNKRDRELKEYNKNVKVIQTEGGTAGEGAYEQGVKYYSDIRKHNYSVTLDKRPHGLPIIGAHKVTEGIEQEPLAKQEYGKRGLVVPGYNYLGPGNDLHRPPPINFADSHAQSHDIGYDKSKSFTDVQKEDIKLLKAAGDHIIEGISGKDTFGDTLGSVIGGIGIGAKYLVEKAVGKSFYPSFTG